MRPNSVESIRAVQVALAETIAPELTSPFAQDAAQTLQMLLESIAGDLDTAAEDLRRDNETLTRLLSDVGSALGSLPRNESLAGHVSPIEQRLNEEPSDSVAISALASRNQALRGTLEQLLMALEDSPDGLSPELNAVRTGIYRHLRDAATRGWSFWDVSSFRGRMTTLRAAGAGGSPQSRAVE
jgi:hypothetical protein